MKNKIYEWDIEGPECDEGVVSYEPDNYFHRFFKKLEDLTDDDWDLIDGFEYRLTLVLKVGEARWKAYTERDDRSGDWVFSEDTWVPKRFGEELHERQRRYSWLDRNLRSHQERCCVQHGCWWLHDDCPVTAKKVPQAGPCEQCRKGTKGEVA